MFIFLCNHASASSSSHMNDQFYDMPKISRIVRNQLLVASPPPFFSFLLARRKTCTSTCSSAHDRISVHLTSQKQLACTFSNEVIAASCGLGMDNFLEFDPCHEVTPIFIRMRMHLQVTCIEISNTSETMGLRDCRNMGWDDMYKHI